MWFVGCWVWFEADMSRKRLMAAIGEAVMHCFFVGIGALVLGMWYVCVAIYVCE